MELFRSFWLTEAGFAKRSVILTLKPAETIVLVTRHGKSVLKHLGDVANRKPPPDYSGGGTQIRLYRKIEYIMILIKCCDNPI